MPWVSDFDSDGLQVHVRPLRTSQESVAVVQAVGMRRGVRI